MKNSVLHLQILHTDATLMRVKFCRHIKGSFISFQLVPDKITPKFHPLCNQKFAQIKKQEVFLDLRKFLVAEGMKFWSNFVWHQLKRDKATFTTMLFEHFTT